MGMLTRSRPRSRQEPPSKTGLRQAAWYDDPYGTAALRWWDGRQWTDQVRGMAADGSGGSADATTAEPPATDPEPAMTTAESAREPAMTTPESAATDPEPAAIDPESAPTIPEPAVSPHQPTAAEPPPEAVRTPAPAAPLNGNAIPVQAAAEQLPVRDPAPARLCPVCATITHTGGNFCPHCGHAYGTPGRGGVSKRVKLAAAGVTTLLLLGGAGVAVAIKLHHDNVLAAQHRQAVAAAKLHQQQLLQRQRAALAQQQAQQAQQQAEVAQRQSLESQLETNITNDSAQKASQGLLFNGAATSTTCTPVSGGSSQDLSKSTGTYNCTAAYQTNSDGSTSGYRYTGTINFSTGDITWQLGGGN